MENRRNELYSLLGNLPSRSLPIISKKLEEIAYPEFILEKWVFDWNAEEQVEGYFVRPSGQNGPFPTIVFNHSHGGNYQLGKDELIQGNTYLQAPSYAEEFTKMGYAVFCIDAWGFGSRNKKTESELFKEMLWKGEVLWGKMVYDTLRAVDYLETRPDVNTEKIGTIGMSMGGVMAWWASAIEPRIKVCCDICGMTDFGTLIEKRRLDSHGIYFYVPRLLNYFTTSTINALIAPRPHLTLAGTNDDLVPSDGLDVIEEQLDQVYAKLGKQEAWRMRRFQTEHSETKEMRQEAKSFFEKWF